MEPDFSKLTFEALQETLLRFLCRHLVSLACWYYQIDENGKSIGEKQFFCCSGFILSINSMWNFATAGHVLEKLEKLQQHLEHKTIQVDEFMLTETFGSGSVTHYSIPFPYFNTPKMYIYKDSDNSGLDFGLVALKQHYQDLLRANGIIPVEEINWKNIPVDLADKYLILGLPQELIKTQQVRDDNGAPRLIGAVPPQP